MSLPSSVVQLVLPPCLLSYFAWAFTRCTGAVAGGYIRDALGRPLLSIAYRAAAWTLVPSITVLFLRLYFLPSKQSVPPPHPPAEIEHLKVLFECAPPAETSGPVLITSHSAEDEGLLQRCARCTDRWKPARTRHCSDCGVCRAGFDHHCAFFANCLTARYMPAFVALTTWTPVTVFLLSLPMYGPLALRARQAWLASTSISAAVEWWAWKWSWIVPCGPVGRWLVGLSLAWRALDAADGGGIQRFELGALVFIGNFLGLVTLALGYTAVVQIRRGQLNIDHQRSRAYSRALADAAALQRQGKPPTPKIQAAIDRFAPRHWFFVPLDHGPYTGVVLSTPPGERPYDAGPSRNWNQLVKRGRWDWFLPWNAVRQGVQEEVWNWPVSPRTREWLHNEAARIAHS